MRKNKDKNKIDKNKKIEKNKETKKGGAFHKFLEIINKKWLVKGTTTIILVCGLFAIYIGVSVFLKNIELPQVDTTENKIYSLSDETKNRIENIDKDITITLINYGEGSEREETIKRYKQINNKINVENIVNATSRPDLMQKYSIIDSQDTLIIVTCGEKEDILTEDDLMEIDYTTFETSDKTERAVTNAIIDVTTDKKPKVYYMNSHTDFTIDYYATLIEKIKNDANEVEELDILTKGGVPEDCNVLIIPTLNEDITSKERDSITEYIKNGGELLLLNGPDLGKIDFSNYNIILKSYGISMLTGIIYEQSPKNMYYRRITINNRR